MSEHSNPTQEAMILDHLRRNTITPIEALQAYGCFRLAARIYRLRKDGHQIATHTIHDARNGKHYASYQLVRMARPEPRKTR